MHPIWLSARADFTFKGKPLRIDDVFSVTPIEAVQLRARRLASFARKPPAESVPVTVALEPPKRGRGRPRKVVAEAAPVEPLVSPASTNTPPGHQEPGHVTIVPPAVSWPVEFLDQ